MSGSRGPISDPPVLQLLKGGSSKRKPAPPPPQPLRTELPPEPPDFLGPHAVAEWQRLAPELHRLRLLTALDVSVFAIYCSAFGHWRPAQEVLAHAGGKDRVAWMRIAKSWGDVMLQTAALFGLTPVARARLAGHFGDDIPPSPLDGLLA